MVRVRIVGAGRAGTSLARALRETAISVDGPLPRAVDLTMAAQDVDMLVLAVSDDSIAEVAKLVAPCESCVVMHLSGSRGLAVLDPHPKVASLHPLVAMPTAERGARRLSEGASFAVAGDAAATQLVGILGGRAVTIAEQDRARYHAAACIASNHIVALLGQVERIARSLGMTLDDFQGLSASALEDSFALSPARALTGPAARGDQETLRHHVEALDVREEAAYRALAEQAERLAQDTTVAPLVDGAGSRADSKGW